MSALPRAATIEVRGASKRWGSVCALDDVSMSAFAGSVTGLLGDNGAGKSTLVGILSGSIPPSTGGLYLDGEPVTFASPRAALRHGIATVYQDLALIPLMSVWRNFILGDEPTRGRGMLSRIDRRHARRVVQDELHRFGIALRDTDQTVGTLSGGERQSVAIARALYRGARVLILDEPTAALGVRQAEIVLKTIQHAKERGVAVIFISHNPGHAYRAADRFVVLRRGRVVANATKSEISRERLADLMAGGMAEEGGEA